MSKKNRIRIFTDVSLIPNSEIKCSENQRHYLLNVMRRQIGDEIYIFNGRDGEFSAQITAADKKQCTLKINTVFAEYTPCPDIWILFAPLKKDNTDFVIAKAVELGAVKIIPVKTEYTASANIRPERLRAQATEAAEQCRRQDVPIIENLTDFSKLLQDWPQERKLIFLDESGQSSSIREIMPQCKAPAALLIGPEGGFSQKELEILRNLSYTHGISLGKRILRAETAAIAALSCWQAFCGDWND